MTATIRPENIPGFNAVGRTTGTTRDLAGMEFLISCPPDLPPRSRIVAVCGTTDVNDCAHPSFDGWFISDFYLFRHILSHSDTRSSNQIWLTCENPHDLVGKYTEYAHGNSCAERRIVLDQETLSRSSMSNLRVVPRRDLLERFLSTVREQARIAHREREQLVLLIFGHGDEETYGVSIGGENEPEDGPRLYMGHIKRLLPQDLSVTVLLSSCFSGGWLVYPDLSRAPGYLNATGIAAASPEKESHSWPTSNSIGRACGGIAASAILECMIDKEEASREATEHPNYIEFAHSIHETVKTLHFLGADQEMHFSAQDDEWETNYRTRTGLPLTSYKSRWESLRSIPPSVSGTDTNVSNTASTKSRKRRRLQVLAKAYLTTKPGQDNAASNVALHNRLKFIMEGTYEFSDSFIDKLIDAVTYRLSSKHEADYLRSQMGIDFPSIFEVDPTLWRLENWGQLPPEDKKVKDERYSKTFRLIIDKHVRTRPIGSGWSYHEPHAYLALVLANSELSLEGIEVKLQDAALHKKTWYRHVYRAWRGNRVAENEVVASRRRALMETVKRYGWKVTERESEDWDALGLSP